MSMRGPLVKSARAGLFGLFFAAAGFGAVPPASLDQCVPARWDGGPLEVARRAIADPAIRDAIAAWYEPATLQLLEGSPINCLLVSFAGGGDADAQRRQKAIIQEYALAARQRGFSILGLVYPGAAAQAVADSAAALQIPALVLEGDFPAGFTGQLIDALKSAGSRATVIPILRAAVPGRGPDAPVLAVEGVQPGGRNLADMGIRAGPSGEPWIDSNIWLVRSLRAGTEARPVWISYRVDTASPGEYVRFAADAAVAGGRWIVALDDGLRAKLRRSDPDAISTFRRIAAYLQFGEDHADWRGFQPYANLAVIVDPNDARPDIASEYLNLAARRQVPYRLLLRSQLGLPALATYKAVLAASLSSFTQAERGALRAFAEKGGLVIAGPSWGGASGESYAELAIGKGRAAVYKDDPPDPEAVARDLKDLLAPEEMGVSVFNVPWVLSYASAAEKTNTLVVQLLNYTSHPADAITIRVNGIFKNARLYIPEAAPSSLAVKTAGGRTEVSVPKLPVWGGVLFE